MDMAATKTVNKSESKQIEAHIKSELEGIDYDAIMDKVLSSGIEKNYQIGCKHGYSEALIDLHNLVKKCDHPLLNKMFDLMCKNGELRYPDLMKSTK
jgi:hypothetical protein